MQNRRPTAKILNFKLWLLASSFSFLLILFLYGCENTFMGDTAEFLTPAGDPNNVDIAAGYEKVKLKQNSAADVLAMMHLPGYELLSSSKSVIAAQGQKKRNHQVWFKMVAFDEDELMANRKYLFIEDERPKNLFVEPWEDLSFDCKMVLESKVLDKPYANNNAKQIALLKQVLENFRKDIKELATDNVKLNTSGMMVNQAFEAALVKLDSSPALAVKLGEPAGMEFEHISFNKGKVRMVIAGDVVTIKMRLGSLVKKFVGNTM